MRTKINEPIMDRSEFDMLDGFTRLVAINGDGSSLDVRVATFIVPQLDNEKIDSLVDHLRDALYRCRPDLRKQ